MNLIDRDALIKEIKENSETMMFSSESQHNRDDEKREYAINMLLDAPIINTVRVAHWINIVRGTGTCSYCNEKVKFPSFFELPGGNIKYVPHLYCPYCGRLMVEKNENERK